MPITLGVLLPTSRMFPGVDQGFLAGLETALAGLAPAPRLAVELTGASAHKDAVREKIQRLLLVERPHAVVGILGAGLVPYVHEPFAQQTTPCLVCNLGADLPVTGGGPNPFILWNSLNLYQSTYALGYWAARHAGRTASMAAGFHEAGYGMVHAFHRGFEEGGGTVLGLGVTHRESATEDPSAEIARLAALGPEVFFGAYAGREGVSFMRAFDSLGLAGRMPLMATPLMTHGHWRPQMGSAVSASRTACSWVPGMHPEDEARFAPASASRGPRPSPDVFALLGYEAGLMIRAALAALGSAPVDGASLRGAMAGAAFASPRGAMRVDGALNEVATIDHFIEVGPDVAGAPAWMSAGTLDLPAAYAVDAAAARAQEAKVGWLNAYLVN